MVKICVYNTDTNLGPISVDKPNVIRECHRQLEKESCWYHEAKLILSKVYTLSIPHLCSIWKILKNLLVGRPIVAGHNWILTPTSIFVGHFLKNFYVKFGCILKDRISLVKIQEKTKFIKKYFLFTVDFESLGLICY